MSTGLSMMLELSREEVGELRGENDRLRAIVTLARMLIQPTNYNGAELVGHKRFRDTLLGAVRDHRWTDPRDTLVAAVMERSRLFAILPAQRALDWLQQSTDVTNVIDNIGLQLAETKATDEPAKPST
jgi:hypothetical protein